LVKGRNTSVSCNMICPDNGRPRQKWNLFAGCSAWILIADNSFS
jgi:hypothetical protein